MRRFVTAVAIAPIAGVILISAGCGFASLALNHVKGSGKIAQETRTLAPFTRIESMGSTSLVVTIGAPQSVLVEADDNILPLVTTSVSNEKLSIGTRGNFSSHTGVHVLITVGSLSELELAGSGQASVRGLNGPSFKASLAGSGDITATGTSNELEVSIAGSGDIRLFDLVAQSAEVGVTGSGTIQVHAAQSLEASVMGSGDIVYAGNPPKLARTVVGSGDISPRH